MREFVTIASVQPFGITVQNDGQVVNGKSLMGIFCLPPMCAHQVSMECSAQEYDHFYHATAQFRP